MYRSSSPSRWPAIIGLGIVGVLAGLGLAIFFSRPQLTATFPSAGALNISSRAPVRLTFNQPMDQPSVESSLRITPNTPGHFEWRDNLLTFTPATPWPIGAAITVTLAGGKSARGLPLWGEQTWSFTVARARLAYLAGATANIWIMPLAEDTPPQQITAEPLGVADYTVSPDGLQFVYAARRADGGADLRLINTDGTGAADLQLCPKAACLSPALSADGQRIAYEQYTLAEAAVFITPRVHIYTLADKSDQLAEDAAETRFPIWSPDGRLSYYDPAREATVVRELNSGAVTYIPNRAGAPVAWAPDGQSVVYPELFFPAETSAAEGEHLDKYYSRLMRVTVATNAAQNLSGADTVEDASPAYAPSGAWLAFGRKSSAANQWTPGRQIWLMRADGAEPHALTADPLYNHSAFRWSADGRTLLCMRFDPTEPEKPAEIWLIPVENNGARRLVTGGYRPEWLP